MSVPTDPVPSPSPNPANLASLGQAAMVGLGVALLARPHLLEVVAAVVLIGGSLSWSVWANKQAAIRLARAMASSSVRLG
jgi:hypothetical protein